MRASLGAVCLLFGACFTEPGGGGQSTGDTTTTADGSGPSTTSNSGGPDESGVTSASTTTTTSGLPGTSSSTGTSPSDWWDTNWRYRSILSFNNGGPRGTTTDVPILVVLTPERFEFVHAESDGRDLRFVQNGSVLSHEIERWQLGVQGTVWVKVPSLDLAGDDFIEMYFGNESASDESDPEGVWSNGYASVLHFSEPVPALAEPIPATIGPDAAYADGTTAFADGVGLAGGCLEFQSGSGHVLIDPFPTDSWTALTLTAWGTRQEEGTARLICKSATETLPDAVFCLAVNTSNTANTLHTDQTVMNANWTFQVNENVGKEPFFVGMTWDASDGDVLALANDQERVDLSPGNTLRAGPDIVAVGAAFENGNVYFGGCVDEVRIASVLRSPEWMHMQRLSHQDLLISFGVEEETP